MLFGFIDTDIISTKSSEQTTNTLGIEWKKRKRKKPQPTKHTHNIHDPLNIDHGAWIFFPSKYQILFLQREIEKREKKLSSFSFHLGKQSIKCNMLYCFHGHKFIFFFCYPIHFETEIPPPVLPNKLTNIHKIFKYDNLMEKMDCNYCQHINH